MLAGPDTADVPNYLPAKPGYRIRLLQEYSVEELSARRMQIDNPYARDLLDRLWKAVEDSGLLRDRSFFQNGRGRLLSDFMPENIEKLQNLLHRLRGEHIGVLILGHEEEVLTRLATLHPLQRMFMPPKMPVDNAGRVRLLLDYVDCITPPFQRTSHAFRRAGLITLLAIISISMVLVPLIYGGWPHASNIFAQLPTLILMAVAGFRRNHTGVRALALYISLCDEFATEHSPKPGQTAGVLP
ncbi:hypothetical protein KDL29_13740 [bacterium]|nr:hypothetical protein [bacterium]